MSKPLLWTLRLPAMGLAATLLVPCSAVATSAESVTIMIPVRGFLCDTREHAVQFADFRAAGESEEIAKDKVGRRAGAEVCGRYIGRAAIQSEDVSLSGGIAYRVTSFRFERDKRIAWLAERSFAPTNSQWNL